MKSWIEECNQHHTFCRRDTSESTLDLLPTRLLDVGAGNSADVRLSARLKFPTHLSMPL